MVGQGLRKGLTVIRVYEQMAAPEVGQELEIGGAEAHHLSRVLRLKPGQTVEVLAGEGLKIVTRCVEIRSRSVLLRVETVEVVAGRSLELKLAAAILKGKAMDLLLRDAAQFGADTIQPLYTERSEVRLKGDRADDKLRRWQQLVTESCKQCGNPWLPQILPPLSIEEYLASHSGEGLLVASLEPQARPLRELLREGMPPALTWLIGPEGDFSAAEYRRIDAAGAAPVRLSSQVLRAETAAACALALTDYECALNGCGRGRVDFPLPPL